MSTDDANTANSEHEATSRLQRPSGCAAGSPGGCRANGWTARLRSRSTAKRSRSSCRSRRPRPAEGASDGEQAAAWDGRSRRFREDTRQQRIEIAHEAEHTFGRKVSWGVRSGGSGERVVMYTTFSVPVMTRLRQTERLVLDTLVDAGVARSRSDALAWCVRLVGEHEDAWLADLRSALQRVEQVRAEGPRSQPDPGPGRASGSRPAAWPPVLVTMDALPGTPSVALP